MSKDSIPLYGNPNALSSIVSDFRLPDNIYSYTGYQQDISTGLMFAQARYYMPEVGRFVSEDSYKGTMDDSLSLNWYIYGKDDPIDNVDPNGHIPTPMEAAIMAQNIYGATKKSMGKSLSGGWTLVDIKIGSQSMKMGIYSRVKADGTTEYALVNRGTSNWLSWETINNLNQPLGLSQDVKDSILDATNFVSRHKENEITMIGHSKGGAEAAANAVATNKNSIVFNPATINLGAYGLNSSKYKASMTAFIVKGEILNNAFGWISSPIDKVVYLPNQHKTPWWVQGSARTALNLYNSIQNHLMNSVKKALKEAGYNCK